jgi:acyl-CoA thioesterase
VTPSSLPAQLAAELSLEGGPEGLFSREITEFWRVEERAYGGYAAALALAGAVKAGARSVLISAYVMFLAPTLVGPVTVATSVLRAGRASAAVRSEILQEGVCRVSAEAWLGEMPALDGDRPENAVLPPGPETFPVAPPLDYRFMYAFDERAVCVPSPASPLSPQPELDFWIRSRIPRGNNEAHLGQLEDVLLLDAHLMDSAARSTAAPRPDGRSLDFALWWHHVEPRRDWLLMRTTSGTNVDGYVAGNGELVTPDAVTLVRATQAGRIFGGMRR